MLTALTNQNACCSYDQLFHAQVRVNHKVNLGNYPG